jgi:NADH:ubiquinone oxidoreductase subunit K
MSAATSVPSLRVGPVFGRRACAVLALSSAGLHAAMLGHASNVVAGLLLAAMITACVYCARDLWLRGTLRAWCVVGLMNIAMIVVHLPAPSHHHGMHVAMPAQQTTLMGLATAIAAVEVAVAMAVLYYRTRGNAQLVSGKPAR